MSATCFVIGILALFGFWIRIGGEMLAVDYRGLGQDMFSDYGPFNMDGEILAFNQNAKGYGRFNLPLARGKQVRFHRQLLQDVLTTTHSVYAPRYSTRRAELRRFPFGRKGNLRSSAPLWSSPLPLAFENPLELSVLGGVW